MQKMLEDNGGCKLACWWGIQPGVTPWQSVKEQLGLRYDQSVGRSDGIYHESRVYGGSPGSLLGYYIALNFVELDGIVQAIEVKSATINSVLSDRFTSDWKRYSLQEVLGQYGEPSQVMVQLVPSVEEGGVPYYLLVTLYDQLGVAIRYEGLATIEQQKIRFCPGLEQVWAIDLWLQVPVQEPGLMNQAIASDERPYFLSLEEAVGMGVDEFYETFRQPDNDVCLEEVPTLPPGASSWIGPLLYPSWALNLEQSTVPVYDLGAGQTTWLPTAEPVYQVLDWSPDGCSLAYLSGDSYKSAGRVHVVNIAALEDTVVLTTPPGLLSRVSWEWSPTGAWVQYGFETESGWQSYLMRSDGTERRPLAPAFGYIRGWLPGDRQALYWSAISDPDEESVSQKRYQLSLLDLDSMQHRGIVRLAEPLDSWADLVITDVSTMQPVPLEMPGEPGGALYVGLLWTADLRYFLLAVNSDCGPDDLCDALHLDLIDVREASVQQLNTEPFGLGGLSQSWDGARVVFTAQGYDEASGEKSRTYLLDLPSGKVRLLGGGTELLLQNPAWSPDGTMLAFDTGYGGSRFVYDLGTDRTTRLPDEFSGYGWSLAWAPRMSYRGSEWRCGSMVRSTFYEPTTWAVRQSRWMRTATRWISQEKLDEVPKCGQE